MFNRKHRIKLLWVMRLCVYFFEDTCSTVDHGNMHIWADGDKEPQSLASLGMHRVYCLSRSMIDMRTSLWLVRFVFDTHEKVCRTKKDRVIFDHSWISSYADVKHTGGTHIPGIPSLPIFWANAILGNYGFCSVNFTVHLLYHMCLPIRLSWAQPFVYITVISNYV